MNINLVSQAKECFSHILDNEIKILILDSETIRIITSIISVTNLMTHYKVVLISLIDNPSCNMRFFNVVYFISPTDANIIKLEDELNNKRRYKSYKIFFNSEVNNDHIHRLAASDTEGLVRQLRDYPLGYIPMTPKVWMGPLDSIITTLPHGTVISRIIFENGSRTLGNNLFEVLSLKPNKCNQGSQITVLILNRKCLNNDTDPIIDWSYQGLLHLVFGIKDNLIKDEESKDITLEDNFWRDHMYTNWVDLCKILHEKTIEYKKEHDDLQKFLKEASSSNSLILIKQLESLKKKENNLFVHSSLIHTLKRYITTNKLYDINKFENEINSKQVDLEKLIIFLNDPIIKDSYVLALIKRYIKHYNITDLQDIIRKRQIKDTSLNVKSETGLIKRFKDIFFSENELKIVSIVKAVLNETIKDEPVFQVLNLPIENNISRNIFVYIDGGFTPMEAKALESMNVVLGGICMIR